MQIINSDGNACPGVYDDRASLTSRPRMLHCQLTSPHEGRCAYHRKGGQGGSWTFWWGVNERPVGYLDDLGYAELLSEVHRLRSLAEYHQIDWKAGLMASAEPEAG